MADEASTGRTTTTGAIPPSVTGTAGMVATTDSLATAAGLSVLRANGNAGDAAVAAAAVLAVTNPQACDLGGDLFALIHRPGESVTALCGAGRAGSGADPIQMRCEDLERVPPRSLRAVTVPGCVDGWLLLHERYGSLPLERVLEPAVTYAAAGFPASPALAAATSQILHLPDTGDLTEPALANRGLLLPGTVIHRPGLATVLSAIVSTGREAFYLGPFGDGLIDLGMGLFSRSDLARVQAEWVEPVHVEAWGRQVWTPPPPSQGQLALAALADQAGETSDPAAATPDGEPAPPFPSAEGDTAAVTIVDRDLMAVSLMQSAGSLFGAHVVEPATTVFLQNRGAAFSLVPGHPAELRPDRRPPHTLAPALVTQTDGSFSAALGTAGGADQPGLLLHLLAQALNPEASPTRAPVTPDAHPDGEVGCRGVVITADGETLNGALHPPSSAGAVAALAVENPEKVE